MSQPNSNHSSDMRLLNLQLLKEMQAAAKIDPVSACFRFNVSPEQLLKLADLCNEATYSVVDEAGQQLLFGPRDHLWKLIDARQSLVRPPVHVAPWDRASG